VPENSRPRMKGGLTRERLFWCLPRAWEMSQFLKGFQNGKLIIDSAMSSLG
jgi:hypothetical protein